MLGNFVSRVTKFCRSKFGEVRCPRAGSYGPREEQLIADLSARLKAFETQMEAMEVRKSATELRGFWVLGNEYLQEAAPWSTFKTDPDAAAAQVRLALNLISVYAVVSQPFIPDASKAIMEALGCDDWSWPSDMGAALATLPAGHAFTTPEVLFAKITDEQREDWQNRFAGTRA